MNKTIVIFSLILTLISLVSPVMGEYLSERITIEKFLKDDKTNERFDWHNTYSGTYAYYFARNASLQYNLSLGRVYVYSDTDSINGYVFNYVKTSDGYYIFIDAQTDKIVTWSEVKNRFNGKPEIGYVKYYHYYPFLYNECTWSCETYIR